MSASNTRRKDGRLRPYNACQRSAFARSTLASKSNAMAAQRQSMEMSWPGSVERLSRSSHASQQPGKRAEAAHRVERGRHRAANITDVLRVTKVSGLRWRWVARAAAD